MQGYLYLDSMDPKQEYGDWSYADIEDPERTDSRWPRMQIENRCYQSREFRKLHMEVAYRQDGLEVSAPKKPVVLHSKHPIPERRWRNWTVHLTTASM